MKLLTIRMCILELNFVVIIKYQNCTYEFSLIIWEKNELLKFQYFFNYNFVLRSRTKLLNTCIKCLDFNDLLYSQIKLYSKHERILMFWGLISSLQKEKQLEDRLLKTNIKLIYKNIDWDKYWFIY